MKELLDKASSAYYTGKPFLTDEEFDNLVNVYGYEQVGAPKGYRDEYKHLYPMYSLQKVFDIAEAPVDEVDCVITSKLDGAAISILYVEGQLQMALTRGNGVIGQDITSKIKTLVPNTIPMPGLLQVTGEVVAPKSVENSRNYASGALQLKDMEEFKSRTLKFFAYDAQPTDKEVNYSKVLTILENWGFDTVMSADTEEYPNDGLVYRIDSNKYYLSKGFTAKHPRGAFALKEQKQGVVTKLLNVVWQVGKSGIVSPVAILEPVKVGDATVSRATLHNIEYIRALDLEIGCNVEIIRSGEIIPRVLKRV